MSRPLSWRLIATAALAFSAYLIFDILKAHPGIAAPDELYVLDRLQGLAEGRGLDWRLGGSPLFLAAFSAWLHIAGSSAAAILAFPAALFGAECALLYAVTRRECGEASGRWALLISLMSAFSLLRARCLLGFTAVPLYFLLMFWWLRKPLFQRALPAAALGMLGALFFFEYDAWIAAALALGAIIALSPASQRPALLPLLLGGLACLALMTAGHALVSRSTLALRGGQLAHAGAMRSALPNLKAFFFGSPPGSDELLSEPSFPLWCWPGLLLGLSLALKERRWLLAALPLAIAPLAFPGAAAEGRRAIAAWPLLCILGGLGWSQIAAWLHESALPSRLKSLLPWAMVFAALLFQAGSYARALDARDALTYSQSRGFLAAQKILAAEPGERLCSLGLDHSAALRLLTAPSSPGQPWAMIPREYAPWPLPPAWGDWSLLPGAQSPRPIYLLRAAPALAARLQALDTQIRALETAMPEADCTARLAILMQALQAGPGMDPWLRSFCCHHALAAAACIGKLPPELLQVMLTQPQQSATPWLQLSAALEKAQPEAALALLRRASAQDPRRKGAWDSQIGILRRLGRQAEADRLQARIDAMGPGSLW